MLKANYQNQLIDLTKVSKFELEQMTRHKWGYTCPDCQAPVLFKCGTKKRAHFAHLTSCAAIESENESEDHQMAKKVLSQWLVSQGAVNVSCEKRFNDINRISDIYFQFQGLSYVFEIQKSPLSESLFKSRTLDYESLNIQVIWIFIGDLTERNQTYLLNRQMRLNREALLIHFDLLTRRVTLIKSRVWLSRKEVKADSDCYSLDRFSIELLFENKRNISFLKAEEWLVVKRQFRQSKWFYYFKTDRRLARLCATHHFNLSLLPAEVGWPIVNNHGFVKPLFIWQAYVLVGIIMSYPVGEVLSLEQMIEILIKRYRISVNHQAVQELKQYLQFLVRQQILKLDYGYYEVIHHPRGYQTLEEALKADERVALAFSFEP